MISSNSKRYIFKCLTEVVANVFPSSRVKSYEPHCNRSDDSELHCASHHLNYIINTQHRHHHSKPRVKSIIVGYDISLQGQIFTLVKEEDHLDLIRARQYHYEMQTACKSGFRAVRSIKMPKYVNIKWNYPNGSIKCQVVLRTYEYFENPTPVVSRSWTLKERVVSNCANPNTIPSRHCDNVKAAGFESGQRKSWSGVVSWLNLALSWYTCNP